MRLAGGGVLEGGCTPRGITCQSFGHSSSRAGAPAEPIFFALDALATRCRHLASVLGRQFVIFPQAVPDRDGRGYLMVANFAA